ncbi:MAG: hypothetical protein DCC68_13680 [Planctomycetota bacterium]|nr:MAG: hypothetical protein DCC68_13680 [Planctomycetota bacterium]
MAEAIRCPQGHRCELSGDSSVLVCPVCGGAAEGVVAAVPPLPRPPPAAVVRLKEELLAPHHRRSVSPPEHPPIDGYEILETLGQGGMGIVYRAWHVRLKRQVALKMVAAGAHARPEVLSRFHTEAEAVARLIHPSIVQVYEVGDTLRGPYISMEYVEGGSLRESLDGTPWTAKRAAEFIATLAEAVHFAHTRGVIHRDLSPGNVLLATDGTPKITDFGLAKLLGGGEGGRTQAGVILGTPSYMPPEQSGASADSIGPPADVYALGAILYELITGRPPFVGETALETARQVVHDEVLSPRRLQRKLPADLETICLKCLEKNPGKRFGSAEALRDDLRRFANDEPIQARPIRAAERAWRWCRRNPMVAALAASVALLLAVIAVGASLTTMRLLHDRRVIVRNLERAESAEQTASDKLWESYLTQARARRWSGRPGRRYESLVALSAAARMRPAPALRNEAIACMALPDLRPVRKWQGLLSGTKESMTVIGFDSSLTRYVRADATGSLSVRRVADDVELLHIRSGGRQTRHLQFSRDGRFVAAIDGKMGLMLWGAQRGEPISIPPLAVSNIAIDFSPDSQSVAVGHADDGTIGIFDLATGKERKRLKSGRPAHVLRFDPTGRRLAVATFPPNEVVIHDLETEEVARLPHPAAPRALGWHPDGKLLATGGSGPYYAIYLWDTQTNTQRGVLRGHQAEVMRIAFHPRGHIMASVAWDGVVRLWDPLAGSELVSCPGAGWRTSQFSADGRLLAYACDGMNVGLWEVTDAPEYRVLRGHRGRPDRVEFSHDGSLLATAADDGVRLWNRQTAQEVAFLDVGPSHSALFHPSGESVITSGRSGVHRWPIETDAQTAEKTIRVGPSVRLAPGLDHAFDFAAQSADGKTIVSVGDAGKAVVVNSSRPNHRVVLDGHSRLSNVAISPDGRFVATGTWKGTGVKVWAAESGLLVQDLPVDGSANVAFDPMGKWLGTATAAEVRLWEIGSWRPGIRVPRLDVGTSAPGRLAFSPDGKLLAISRNSFLIQLVEPVTGDELATLESPEPHFLTWLSFSADGCQLAATSQDRVVQVWDLGLIRRQLAAMNLGWDPPPR